ncbi:hypothetical protein CAPTEDRAFT_185893 [Capitella teleta]|uniref:Uncharacterized protein n=1 Tax=Capitella teleta TaxID=283909 RepID=R7TDV3_CAPTE|nr:hypothetical protein CAPTEDRAFT_185893 [Capitella teleta]|eukprot:ELT91692.1 hypothetical protein CAPTEDRAFT_185893 [Capitella teleta]
MASMVNEFLGSLAMTLGDADTGDICAGRIPMKKGCDAVPVERKAGCNPLAEGSMGRTRRGYIGRRIEDGAEWGRDIALERKSHMAYKDNHSYARLINGKQRAKYGSEMRHPIIAAFIAHPEQGSAV